MNFTPVVNGNRIHLKVRPEVSTLDFANAIVLNGFRIPALSTRRTETEIELNNGQTFAVAGLMNNTVNTTMQKIPGIGDIPILGLLFKSKAAQKNQTELVVMITPEILPNNSNGVTNALPKPVETYMPPVQSKKGLEQPAPAFRPNQGAALDRSRRAGGGGGADDDDQRIGARRRGRDVGADRPTPRTVVNGDAAKPANASATPRAAAPRPVTEAEKKALARAQKQELAAPGGRSARQGDRRCKAAKEAQARAAKQGEEDRRRLEAERKQAEADKQLQEKAARNRPSATPRNRSARRNWPRSRPPTCRKRSSGSHGTDRQYLCHRGRRLQEAHRPAAAIGRDSRQRARSAP